MPEACFQHDPLVPAVELSSAASAASAAVSHVSTSASGSLARASIRPYDIALCLRRWP